MSHLQRIKNAVASPPRALISRVMQGIVVAVTQGNGELVRHLETERARLREANMMGLSRPATAYQAGLFGDEGKVSLIAHPLFLRKGQLTRRLRGAGRKNVPCFAGAFAAGFPAENHLTRPLDAIASASRASPVRSRSARALIRSLRADPITCSGLSSPRCSARSNVAKLSRLASQKA